MSRWQVGSLVVVLTCFILMGIWDIVALSYSGRKATISYLFTMASYYWPLGVFILGAIAGHFFWPQMAFQDDVIMEKRTEIVVDEKGNIKSFKTFNFIAGDD